MPARRILYGQEARQKLLKGALTLVRAVASTYGPAGRTALIQRFAGHLSTKDGLTVAQEITLSDRTENLGCQVLKQACIQVNKACGDGTTSTAIIAGALLREGHKRIIAGEHPRDLIQQIERDTEQACRLVQECSHAVTSQKDLYRVALIACNGDVEIAQHLSEACMAVGKDGHISIVDGYHVDSEIELKDGMEIDQGTHLHFLTGEKERVLEGAFVAVFAQPLVSFEDVYSVLDESTQWPDNPLLVFAPRIEGAAWQTLALNFSQKPKVKDVCPIWAPGAPHQKLENLRDIAAITGATLVDHLAGMDHKKWNCDWFGTVRRATVTKDRTLLEAYAEHQGSIENRLKELRREYEALPSGFSQDQLRERMGKLSGGIAILRVGGVTEAARKERRARIEDALGAVQQALQGGVVPGAGAIYSWVADRLPAGPLQKALRQPLQTLLQNAAVKTPLPRGLPDWFGWDFSLNGIRDLSEPPLIADSTKIVTSVIRSAVSVATSLLSVETTVSLQ